MKSPVIGITCTFIRPHQEQWPPRLGQNRTYLRAVTRAGGVPLLIPHLSDQAQLRTLYEMLDGLLLPGGEDVEPVAYQERPHDKLGLIDAERDATELELARWAMDGGLPLLAICRGIQVLNVALGGSLYQDIQAQIPEAQKHDWYPGYDRSRLSHDVEVSAGTRLAQIVGPGTLPVNSLHHQSLKETAPGLTVVARAPDSVVEAAEAKDHPFALAVQWHPEELVESDVRAQRLFDALVVACRS